MDAISFASAIYLARYGAEGDYQSYSPTLMVEPALPDIVTSPTSVVASVLVSMTTPPRSPTTSHVAAASASIIPSTVVSIKPVESSGADRLPD